MIWSVSISLTGRTTTREVKVVNGSMVCLHSTYSNGARIGDLAGDGGGGGGERAGQEGAPAFALAAFEVAVAGADRVLAGLELVAVHGDAHAAARFAPFGAGFFEDLVQTFGFRLAFDLLRARHHQHAHARRPPCGRSDMPAAWRRSEMRPLVQLPMKTTSTGCPSSGSPGLQAHVGQGFFQRGPLAGIAAHVAGSGMRPLIGMPMPGLVPKVIIGSRSAASRLTRAVIHARPRRWAAACQSARLLPRPRLAARTGRPARYSKVVSSGAIIPARAPASIDILQTVMRSSMSGADGCAGVFEHVPGAAAHADLGDQRQDDIFGA